MNFSDIFALIKSQVKAHLRPSKTGKISPVKAYTNSKTKKGKGPASEKPKQNATGRKSANAGAVRGKSPDQRPGIVVASEKHIPKPEALIPASRYKGQLDDHQRLGVNLALTRFKKGGRGFLLADGTGVGKTRELLVTGHEWAKRSKKPVLIVTQNKQVINGSFKDDGEALGISFNGVKDNLIVATYDDLRTGKVGKGNLGLVIFDEAHNLKNSDSAKAEAASKIKADHRLYATATPMDRPTAASYFLAEITGFPEDRIRKDLGFKLETVTDKYGNEKTYSVLEKGMSWEKVLDNIIELRDVAIGDGAMIRREYPFYGNIGELTMDLTAKQKIEQSEINAHYDGLVEGTYGTRRMSLEGQRLLELSRWLEPYKLDMIENNMMADLSAGRSVVIIAEGVNKQKIKGLGDVERDGFIGQLAGRLTKARIPFAKVYGPGQKGTEVEKFQSGEARVVLATPQSGGTGINLDDTVGDRPRSMYVVTPNFSGDVFDQIMGRVSRRNTASPAEVRMVYANQADSDTRRRTIVNKKIQALRRIQHGEDADAARGFEDTGENYQDKRAAEAAPKPRTQARDKTVIRRKRTASDPAGSPALGSLNFDRYSDKATVITGNTFAHKESIKAAYRSLGIKPMWHGKAKGWLVPTSKVEAFKDEFGRLSKSQRRRQLMLGYLLRRAA